MKKILLLIDDDEEDHQFFVDNLSKFDDTIHVVSAYNGVEALYKLRTIQPKWIFLDLNMPLLNGMDVLKKIKEEVSYKDIPVYIYSTSDGYNSKRPALKLGAAHYFRKPVTIKGLNAIFEVVFGKKQSS